MFASLLGSRGVNILFNLALLLICLVCYVLLVLIFVTPASLRLESLVSVQPGKLQPTVAVTLLAAVLVAATSALATRCVEQSLWRKLSPDRTIRKPISTSESHRLAQWSVSPLARLLYFFAGRSWLLKLGGVLLLSQVALSPVLLIGITQRDTGTTSVDTIINDTSAFTGFVVRANGFYNGGSFSDIPMTSSALAAMQNLSAPAARNCEDSSCTVDVRAGSIFA